MSTTDVICRQCGSVARILRTEGQLFPMKPTDRPMMFHIIDCPKCGQHEQPDGHDGRGGPIDSTTL